jgi:hypothetical protein
MARPPARGATTLKGLGYEHQQQRAKLMRQLDDGTPCAHCGRPMYRDAVRNWDSMPLEADHTLPRSRGGTIADRLLHAKCNRSRGAGDDTTTTTTIIEYPTVTSIEWFA